MQKKLFVFILLVLLLVPLQSRAQDDFALVLTEAEGPVVPALQSYIERGIEEGKEDGAEVVIIQLDTPGGSVAIMQEIVQSIRNADVPVVVYVSPKGSMAASAGTLITLAGHRSAMAPESVIGAASPISGDGSDLTETADTKAKEVLTASIRSLTEDRPLEAQQLAEATITDAVAVSAREALEVGLVDYVAEDVDDLLRQLDGEVVVIGEREITLQTANLSTEQLEMSLPERILMVLTDPTLVFTLLGVGVLLIVIEMRVPGGWVAGTLGVTSFALSIYGLGILPVNWLGLVFFGLAIVLFILELQTPATNGTLSFAAALSMAAGGVILLDTPEVQPFGGLSMWVVVIQTGAIGLAGMLIVRLALRAQRLAPATGVEGLLGLTAVVRSPLDPEGMVYVNGEYWRAESLTGRIEKGEEVEVVEMSNMFLRVRGKKHPPSEPIGG